MDRDQKIITLVHKYANLRLESYKITMDDDPSQVDALEAISDKRLKTMMKIIDLAHP